VREQEVLGIVAREIDFQHPELIFKEINQLEGVEFH
jgi:hypothetical protein